MQHAKLDFNKKEEKEIGYNPFIKNLMSLLAES